MRLEKAAAALLLATALSGASGCKGNINNDAVSIPFTTRASLTSRNQESNSFSFSVSISGDGRYAAFVSDADNLVPGDTNFAKDVFVRDLLANTTILVSVDSAGGPSNADSFKPAISEDGRFVAFVSAATDLQTGVGLPDGNGVADIFVRDLSSGTTLLFSVGAGAAASGASDFPAIAVNSTHVYVSYQSFAGDIDPPDAVIDSDIFVRRVPIANFATSDPTGIGEMVSRNALASDGGNGGCEGSDVALTSTSCYVVFDSRATDLPVAGADANLASDVFVRTMALDLTGGTTALHSVADGAADAGDGGSSNPVISRDARFIAFESTSTDLVKSDFNGRKDIFRRGDIVAGGATTERVSISTADDEAFDDCENAAISSDGRFVAFNSTAPNLVEGDSNSVDDIFIRDTLSGTTTRKSVRTFGGQANGPSFEPAISGTGSLIAFLSFASNLVDGDTNFALDVFRHGL